MTAEADAGVPAFQPVGRLVSWEVRMVGPARGLDFDAPSMPPRRHSAVVTLAGSFRLRSLRATSSIFTTAFLKNGCERRGRSVDTRHEGPIVSVQVVEKSL
jgi:hypothetical protein